MKQKKPFIFGIIFNILAFMIFCIGLSLLNMVSGFETLFTIGSMIIFLTSIFAILGAICSYKSYIIMALLALLFGYFTFKNAGFFYMIFIMSFFLSLIIGFMVKKGKNQKEIIIYGAPLGILSYIIAVVIYCYDKFGNNFFSFAYDAAVAKLNFTISNVMKFISDSPIANTFDKASIEKITMIKENVQNMIMGYGVFLIIGIFVFFFFLLRLALGVGPYLNSEVKGDAIGNFSISKSVTYCYILTYILSLFLSNGVFFESVNYAILVVGFIFVINAVSTLSRWLKRKRVPSILIEFIAFTLIIMALLTVGGRFFSAYYLLMLIGVYASMISGFKRIVIK